MGKRKAFEDEEAARIWTLWKEGATLSSIGCSRAPSCGVLTA
jgi:hypothetical protein